MKKKKKRGRGWEVKRNILSRVPEEYLEYGTGEVITFQYCLNKPGMVNAIFINFRKEY